MLQCCSTLFYHHTHTTPSRVKFWIIKNYMSPHHKATLPELARQFNFDYEFVTYKWPHWLHKQARQLGDFRDAPGFHVMESRLERGDAFGGSPWLLSWCYYLAFIFSMLYRYLPPLLLSHSFLPCLPCLP